MPSLTGFRLLPCILPAVLWLAGAVARAQPPQNAEPTIASAVSLLRSGDPEAALRETRRLLQQTPQDCRLWSLQAVTQQALGQSGPALTNFHHALSLCPASLAALEGAAQLEYAAHDPAALAHLRSILAQRPDDSVSHAMLAGLLAGRGQCAAALPHFAAAQPLFQAQPALLGDYGACLLATAHYDEAVTIFTALSDARPDAQATRDLAYAQWKAGHAQQALSTLKPLLDAHTDEDALQLASAIDEDAGDVTQAVALLREAIVLAPQNVGNYLAFARLAAAHKSFQVGVDMIDAGLRVLPDAATLYVARGVLQVQLSQPAAAVADFERAHQLDPHLSAAMSAIGVLEEQQRNPASLALFRHQAALHPNDALLQFLLAEALSEQAGADIKEAIAAALRAGTLEPTYRPAFDLLATLYLRQGSYAAAVSTAQKALTLDPNDVQAIFTEIRAKSRLGQTAELPALSKRLAAAQSATQIQASRQSRYRLTDH